MDSLVRAAVATGTVVAAAWAVVPARARSRQAASTKEAGLAAEARVVEAAWAADILVGRMPKVA